MPTKDRDPKAIGEMIRQARHNADLTIEELAWRAKISLSTLKNAEHGRRRVTDKTLMSLQRILGSLCPVTIAFGSDAAWLTELISRHDVGRMIKSLRHEFRKNDGIIPYEALCFTEEATHKYMSVFAGQYYDVFLREEEGIINKLTKAISVFSKNSNLDLVMLTCAHGTLEVLLAHYICDCVGRALNIFLVHSSLFLLTNLASKFIETEFADQINLFPIPSRHEEFMIPPICNTRNARNRRLFCILGSSSSYESCQDVFENISRQSIKGDFLLIDVDDFPECDDYRLNGEMPFESNAKAFWEYLIKKNQGLNWNSEEPYIRKDFSKDPLCDYTVNVHVPTHDDTDKHSLVSVLRINRFSLQKLVDFLDAMGWSLLKKISTGKPSEPPFMTYLLLFSHR